MLHHVFRFLQVSDVQVRLFFPELGHPAFGVIRAIVKDSADAYNATGAESFLDSDGEVGQLTRDAITPALQVRFSASLNSNCQILNPKLVIAGQISPNFVFQIPKCWLPSVWLDCCCL